MEPLAERRPAYVVGASPPSHVTTRLADILSHERRSWTVRLPRPRYALLAVLMALLQLPDTGHGQDCPQCSIPAAAFADTTSSWVVTKEVNEVNVVFTAAMSGKMVSDLSENDIAIRDDQKPPAAILDFRTQHNLPLRLGLLIDTSDSITNRFRFEQRAATAFLRQTVERQGDLGFVVGFNNTPTLMQDFADDPDLLAQGIERLKLGGGTALYDAIHNACRKMVRRRERDMVARVMVVVSDGDDNSSKMTLEGTIDAAQQAEVTIYAITTGGQEQGPSTLDPFHRGNSNLRKLAEQTGGRLIYPANAKGLSKAFSKIEQELRSRYAVSYRPADFKPDGHYRPIKITARKLGRKLQLRARKGYYARGATAARAGDTEPPRN